jgi:hypothetical protein
MAALTLKVMEVPYMTMAHDKKAIPEKAEKRGIRCVIS